MEFTILLSLPSGESSFGILESVLDSYLMMHRYRCILLICQRNGKTQFTHDNTVISSTIIFLVLLSCLFWSVQEIYSWYWITMPYLYNLSSWPWFISLYLNYFTTLDSTTIWALSWSQCSVQFSSVAQSHLTLCNPMNRSMPGLPVHHQLPEFTQTHVHRVGDAIQASHPLSSPSPPAPNPSQHESLSQWVNSLHEVAKVLEFQL